MTRHRQFFLCPLVALIVAGTAPAAGQTRNSRLTQAEQTGRTIDITVYGKDPCPTSDDGSIIVCARKPESERYRIPKELREKSATDDSEQGWGSRALTTEEASRTVLPDSCSTIGSNGFTGCLAAAMRQWYAEQRAAGNLRPITR